jgi:phospholipase D1/2
MDAAKASDPDRLLRPGRNCWRTVRAERFSLIVDAASYFRHLRSAMLAARHSVILIGWDFDTRVRLDPEHDDPEWPSKLGAFINKLVEKRPSLRVHILKWDLGMIATLGRGATPLFILDWITSERIQLRLDRVHPLGASHHQKIAVIDDVLAFCGGIDVTVGRWDTREHKDEDPRRTSPFGFRQPPWHDATTAVSGEAAKALGALARQRWQHATKEELPLAGAAQPIWPEDLEVTLEDVEVGISRTQPAHEGEEEVREIEILYLDAIRRARKLIYLESQYFASHRIGEALASRLGEEQGPEIVVINPQAASGWLEEEVMGSARSLILRDLAAADRHDRFRIFHPVAAGGTPIYVHAKIMIVDDTFLRVGSSNLNNRSMGLDTECDLALEASPQPDGKLAARIQAIRHDILAEHLGVRPEEIAAAEQTAGGSLLQSIEKFRRPQGRSLHPVRPLPLTDLEQEVARKHLLDPERARPLLPHLSRAFGEIQRLRRGGGVTPSERSPR